MFEQLRIYYDSAGKTLNEHFATNLKLLNEDGDYNYVAYLMADINNISVKVAKYQGLDRVELVENNEYGYCSLVKATKQVLDKVNLENRTAAKITPKERIEKRLWDPVAIREALINAFVHNDYSREIAPKFEFFSDRLKITSYGGLPESLSQEEFFEGFSVPRNKEIMRIFKDLNLVEQLGSGVPRILRSYGKDCFKFSENFLRMSFPASEQATPQVTPHDTPQVEKLLNVLEGEMNRPELQNILGLIDDKYFRENYLQPALEKGYIEMTIPDKPKSKLQKYRLTPLGKKRRDALTPY